MQPVALRAIISGGAGYRMRELYVMYTAKPKLKTVR